MIELTETAANAIRSAISGSQEKVEGLRIMVQSGGCSGNKYMMGLVQTAQEGDVVVEHSGVKLFVEPNSVALLNGVTLDFTIGLEGAGFTFNNPNATSSCSCGKSFS
ncbi:MAG TPA: iron-sulfur cluster assembly accessory protein [Polyangiaceae bacterium]|nr:iron-sulfur cluster assembly accessory protein [Polyangiaceae bacterium]